MSWNAFKDLAKKRLQSKGINSKIQESLVIEQANNIIVVFFGEEAHNKARAVYFKEGILTIAVLSNSLFNEIDSQKQEFINILNNKLGEELVTDLRFLN